jgi:hypothetical protein
MLIKTVQINNINIKRGIFQGDASSPLWFTLAINPLSTLLNSTQYGFKMKENQNTQYTISHMLYMDDLKLYASNESQLKHLINITNKFSQDTGMTFGLNKCRTLHIKSGKISDPEQETFQGIRSMSMEQKYKYLGIKQARIIDYTSIKQDITKEFQNRLNMILKTELNARNTTKAINTFAIPILCYTFGITKWTVTDLDRLQGIIRTTLTKYGTHHPHANSERMVIPRKEGGTGIIDIRNLHNRQIINLRDHFHSKQNIPLYQIIATIDKDILISLAPQPNLGLGPLHKIWLNFLEASQQFSFYRVGLLAPRPTPIPDDQASVFISPRGRVATHFSRLLRHAWVTVALFLHLLI